MYLLDSSGPFVGMLHSLNTIRSSRRIMSSIHEFVKQSQSIEPNEKEWECIAIAFLPYLTMYKEPTKNLFLH
jgi:hypothetical protein